jgi:tetratricopeptide (TPR) repeat protein
MKNIESNSEFDSDDHNLINAKEYFLRGLHFSEKEELEKAEKNFLKSLEFIPDRLSTLSNLAIIYIKLDKLKDAIALLNKTLIMYPKDISLHLSLALAYERNNNFTKALYYYEEVLKIDIKNSDAIYGKAFALHTLGSINEAIKFYSEVIILEPDNVQIYNNLGIAYVKLKKFDEARICFSKSIKINSSCADSHFNLGLLYQEHQIYEDAAESYRVAIKLNPMYSDAILNLGLIYQEQGKLSNALNTFDMAINTKINFVEAYYNKGNVLSELKRYKEALECYKYAYDIYPDYDYLLGTFIFAKMQICDWSNLEEYLNIISNNVNKGKKTSPCLSLQILTDSARLQLKNTLIWANDKHPSNYLLGDIKKSPVKQKIRIGYYSSDFRNHPVSYLLAEYFESYDRSKFEIYGFYFGPSCEDEFHTRISNCLDLFIDVAKKTDKQVAELSRDLHIDIAVDLNGYTSGARTNIFSFRVAPIQTSYIGYLGTMGVEYYDYLIADQTLIPCESQQYYSEKIVYLNSYQANDANRKISNSKFTRFDFGIPENGFIFCSLNSSFKITPTIFDLWMKILHKVPESFLFLVADDSNIHTNLILEAKRLGISQGRLLFGERLERSSYLARYNIFDLFLDTFPYNAGTTASDSLWMELPLLTLRGEAFASRIASSLLTAIDIPELIACSPQEYVDKAVKLAINPEEYSRIKKKLQINKLKTPLFDTRKFKNNLENAYIKMYSCYMVGAKIENIYCN